MKFFEDILNIFFPKVCATCGDTLVKNEELICFKCRTELPRANHQSSRDNELKDRFVGKLKVEYAWAGLLFYKSGITQKLLHEFKYNDHPEIGELFGRQLAQEINEEKIAEKIDMIIPVPLHPKKERKRGYNQSHYFANGISEITKVPVHTHYLKRIKHSESQTGKSREIRWKSVENAFEVQKPSELLSRHILLVDDVITTGATIEACGKKLYEAGVSKISIAALAIAK